MRLSFETLACVSLAALGVQGAAADVAFRTWTLPETAALSAAVETSRTGDVWDIVVTARNDAATNATFKLVLEAEPGFSASRYLIPGVNYNGNNFVTSTTSDGRQFSLDIPSGWEKDGEPWTFAYDRCSIPSCTISENADSVFALFASVADVASHVSSCSMVRNADGSFRHRIVWPVTEAPYSYTDKRTFTERYDTYLTLKPGETFSARAFACAGKPPWPNYGFAAIFPAAWRLLKPDVPSQLPVSEVMRLDKSFQDWSRRRDENGASWYKGFLVDQTILLGNHRANAPTNVTLHDIEMDPAKNWWVGDLVEKSKRLRKGTYFGGPGDSIGFSAQSFQLARLSVEYGIRNRTPDDLDFGLKVFDSWIDLRQKPSGHFGSQWKTLKWKHASDVGWALAELSRLTRLLEASGLHADKYRTAAKRQADAILRVQREDGNLGSKWMIDSGEVVEWGGDCGGYVLMGLARYWQLTHDAAVRGAIDRAFAYYYGHDIDRFECKGGAMDCSSIDREGIHPFFTAALVMAEGTGEGRYVEFAQKAGWYFFSWLYCHNGVYGPETDFAKYRWKPAGATIVGTEHPALDDYGCVLVADLVHLSRIDGNRLWKDAAALIWRNATQGFPTEKRKIWHALERPPGAKNEAYFQTRWSKYRTGEHKRGHLNDLCTAWGGVYRTSSVYDLSAEDLLWLESVTRP